MQQLSLSSSINPAAAIALYLRDDIKLLVMFVYYFRSSWRYPVILVVDDDIEFI